MTATRGGHVVEVEYIWGGTAGSFGRRTIDLDEMEIMVVARRV